MYVIYLPYKVWNQAQTMAEYLCVLENSSFKQKQTKMFITLSVHPTGSEATPPYAVRSSRFCSEPLPVEDDVDVWRYAILRVACQKRRRRRLSSVHCLLVLANNVVISWSIRHSISTMVHFWLLQGDPWIDATKMWDAVSWTDLQPCAKFQRNSLSWPSFAGAASLTDSPTDRLTNCKLYISHYHGEMKIAKSLCCVCLSPGLCIVQLLYLDSSVLARRRLAATTADLQQQFAALACVRCQGGPLSSWASVRPTQLFNYILNITAWWIALHLQAMKAAGMSLLYCTCRQWKQPVCH